MNDVCNVLNKLPEEIEEKIWKDLHGYDVYKINQKIKYEVGIFGNCNMDGGVIYELWFNMGLKQIPQEYWGKIKNHHRRYYDKYEWDIFEKGKERWQRATGRI